MAEPLEGDCKGATPRPLWPPMGGPLPPQTFQFLLSLPGIGQNTAHAIMAFAYHAPYAVMEANVKRILARIFALKTPKPNAYWEHASQLLNRQNPFDYNQAMMDLGAMLCTPKAPACNQCPAAEICQGKHTPEAFPEKRSKKKVPLRKRHAYIAFSGKDTHTLRLHIEKREDAFLGGLHGFTQSEEATPPSSKARFIGTAKHAYSHFKIEVSAWLTPAQTGDNQLYSLSEIAHMPLSTLDHKILNLITNTIDNP